MHKTRLAYAVLPGFELASRFLVFFYLYSKEHTVSGCVVVCIRMAAQTTDRLFSSTEVPLLASRRGDVAGQTWSTGRCQCCPYGYHIDVDFLDYLNTIKAGSGLSKLKKIRGRRLRQRQAMETELLMIRPPTTSPPPQRQGLDDAWTDVGESSDSLSPVTPRSLSDDERENPASSPAASRLLMADLDASIADALDSIDALMKPRQPSVYDNITTMETPAAACRSASMGDVRWSPGAVEDQSSPSTTQGPPSSVSSLQTATSTAEVFPSTLTQPFSTDSRRGYDSSNLHSSDVVELCRHSETTSVSSRTVIATTTIYHESSQSPPPCELYGVPTIKSSVTPPPVKPRTMKRAHIAKDSSSEDDVIRVMISSSSSSGDGSDAVRRLPTVPRPEIPGGRDPDVDERQTASRSTVPDSSVRVQTTTPVSVPTTTTTSRSSDVITSGRQLPVPPKPREQQPETSATTGTSRESSFSSVRALLNRKSGGTQRSTASRVDRPARRSRQPPAIEAVPTNDVTSAPAETASAPDRSETVTEESTTNCSSETTKTSAISEVESVDPISPEEMTETRSCSSPSSLRHGDVDDDSLKVSYEELSKAMAILTPVSEGRQDGCDDTKLNETVASSTPAAAVNPDVLMTIRKYIASSLQQMRLMEQQVKLVPVLQLRVSVLKEEKRLLKMQLHGANNKTTSKRDASVGVDQGETSRRQNGSSPASQVQFPVKHRNAEVGNSHVETNTDSLLYCYRCSIALGGQSLLSSRSSEIGSESGVDVEETTRTESAEAGSESVSQLVSKLQCDVQSSQRSWSAEKTVHDSVLGAKDDGKTSIVLPCSSAEGSSAFTAWRRPKPPVPYKEISIRREESGNLATVGIQCTLLKDSAETSQNLATPPLLTPELDAVNKHRSDFRAQEPDLVTTHQLWPAVAHPLKTFADKETETERTSKHSAAVNTDTLEETVSKSAFIDVRSPHLLTDCSVNTDISGDLWKSGNYHMSVLVDDHLTVSEDIRANLDVRLEPEICQQMGQPAAVCNASHRTAVDSESIEREVVQQSSSVFTVDQETVCNVGTDFRHSVKDASCSVDIVTRPVMIDVYSCTDDSLLSSLIADVSKLKHAVEAKALVKDVECSADISTKPLSAAAACNTEISVDQLLGRLNVSQRDVGCNTEAAVQEVLKNEDFGLTECSQTQTDDRRSETKEAWCQVDTEKKPLTCEVACGDDQPQLIDARRGFSSHLVGVACGRDDVISTSVQDAFCNTDVQPKTDVGCSTANEQHDVSCLADVKLSVCDKCCGTDFEAATDDGQSGKTGTTRDSSCMTDSLVTMEMSSSTEEFVSDWSTVAGARSSRAEAECMMDISWKTSSDDAGSTTVVTSLTNVDDVSDTQDALPLKPPSADVATTTDAWLLTSDQTFVDTLKQLLQPSVTDTASMTDSVEQLQTADTSSLSSMVVTGQTSERSTNTDAEIKPLVVDVASSAQPTVCEVGCYTEEEVRRQQVRDTATSTDPVFRLSTTDVSVNTDTEEPSGVVGSSSNITVSSFAAETASVGTSSSSLVFSDFKVAAASTAVGPSVCHVAVGTEATSSVDAAVETDCEPMTRSWSRTDASCGSDVVCQRDKEVMAKADTSEIACDVAFGPTLRSSARGIDAEVVSHDTAIDNIIQDVQSDMYAADLLDADVQVFPETSEIGCNTENVPMSWRLTEPGIDMAALNDVSATDTVYSSNDEAAKTCRYCGAQSKTKTSVRNAATITEFVDVVSCRRETEDLLSSDVAGQLRTSEHFRVEEIDLADDSAVDDRWRQVGVNVKPETKDAGCEAERSLHTSDMAINTDNGVKVLEAKEESDWVTASGKGQVCDDVLGSESHFDPALLRSTKDEASTTESSQQLESVPSRSVASDTSDMMLSAYRSDDTSILFDARLIATGPLVEDRSSVVGSVTGCPVCLAKPPTQDSSCETDTSLMSGDRLNAADGLEFSVRSRAVCEVGCNTDMSRAVPTTAEVECNTDPWNGMSPTRSVDVTDAARKPSRIPHRVAARSDSPPVAKPVAKDAFCITDITIAPSDSDEVLMNYERTKLSRAVRSTSEVACNTAATTDVGPSGSDGVENQRPQVREVGCSADLATGNQRPSTRDAGCTARPLTQTRSCTTDSASIQPETPVRTERTRTGLQVSGRQYVFYGFSLKI